MYGIVIFIIGFIKDQAPGISDFFLQTFYIYQFKAALYPSIDWETGSEILAASLYKNQY